MAIFELILGILGKSKTVVHLTRNSGDSLKAQQILKEAGINFDKEIEGMASTHLQTETGHVSPVIKLKVKPSRSFQSKRNFEKH